MAVETKVEAQDPCEELLRLQWTTAKGRKRQSSRKALCTREAKDRCQPEYSAGETTDASRASLSSDPYMGQTGGMPIRFVASRDQPGSHVNMTNTMGEGATPAPSM